MTGGQELQRRPEAAARRRADAAWAVLCAALALLFASTASPLYAANFWTDTNVYFTIGRGLRAGLMPYRDLFDHKGPLLYALYGLAALISERGFLGVFLLETASLAALLRLAQGLAEEHGERRWRILVPPLLALAACCSRAFDQGGSAEEFCLPALMLGLCSAVRLMRLQEGAGARRASLAFGAAAAWVFLIKYTDCGLFFGLAPCALLCVLRRRGAAAAGRACLAMLAGFALPAVPTVLWLLCRGALADCVQVYFVQNLTEYGGPAMSLAGHLRNALAYLRTQSAANPALALLTAAAVVGFPVSALVRRLPGALFEALAVPAGAGLLLLFCYWGEMAHPYYALVFAATAAAGLAWLPAAAECLLPRGWPAPAAALACALALPFACGRLCQAAPLRAVGRENMPQTAFAREMRSLSPEPTLLDLTSLDQGFYLAAGILPNCRYFADNNLETREKREAIEGYLREGRCEFVVTVWKEPGEGYEPIARMEGVFDLNDRREYTLWHRRAEP